MCWTFILLVTLSILTHVEAVTKVSVTCPGHQKPHGGSCYEVVGLRHTFPGARAWCEQRGGHLACIPDEETQLFLQRHLDPDEDFWFGAASCATKAAHDSSSEGFNSLVGSILGFSILVSAEVFKHHPDVWFLDGTIGVLIGLLIFAYGAKLLMDMVPRVRQTRNYERFE